MTQRDNDVTGAPAAAAEMDALKPRKNTRRAARPQPYTQDSSAAVTRQLNPEEVDGEAPGRDEQPPSTPEPHPATPQPGEGEIRC